MNGVVVMGGEVKENLNSQSFKSSLARVVFQIVGLAPRWHLCLLSRVSLAPVIIEDSSDEEDYGSDDGNGIVLNEIFRGDGVCSEVRSILRCPAPVDLLI
jgi:hypothetical protein